jgi:hypothetical protein
VRTLTSLAERGQTQNPTLQAGIALSRCAAMVKKLPLGLLLLMTGCATTFTNLTPQRQLRNPDNLYQVEFALASRQQSLRWDTIEPQVVLGTETYPMRLTPLMTNRWEAMVPIPKNQNSINYRYKVDYEYNALGQSKSNNLLSPEYTLKIGER